MTAFVLAIEGLFLALSLLAEVMDRWTCEGGHDHPERVFPHCFVA